jgi:hypothetical protein
MGGDYPAKAALNSSNLLNYRISEPRIMGYLRNNSMFAFGKAYRTKSSSNVQGISVGSTQMFERSPRRVPSHGFRRTLRQYRHPRDGMKKSRG